MHTSCGEADGIGIQTLDCPRILYLRNRLQGESRCDRPTSKHVEEYADGPEAKEQSEVCPMRNSPLGGGDACYATVLEHNGDLDEEDCEVKDGVIRVSQLDNVVLLVNRMLKPQRTDCD